MNQPHKELILKGANQEVVILVHFPFLSILPLFLRSKHHRWLGLSVYLTIFQMMYFHKILYIIYTAIFKGSS